jgi:hypothetical protein
MLSRLSYEMMKHCMEERPIQKNKNNSIIEIDKILKLYSFISQVK